MEVLRLTGPTQLRGTVDVRGAKNSVLKLMAASLLAVGRTTITNVPAILDVRIMVELLSRLGCTVDYDAEAGTVSIDVPAEVGIQADYELVRAMRASISVLGPLTARMRAAHVALPGGDAIGSRGLDMHQAGLEALGAQVRLDHGYFVAEAPTGLTGTDIALDFPSVGATENLVMAATLAQGTTTVANAAKEPEIVDICLMLVQMGARIEGIGTAELTITGVDELHPVDHRTVGDRIVAGTYAFAAALSAGDVVVRGVGLEIMPNVAIKLRDAGATVDDLGEVELGDGTLGRAFRVVGHGPSLRVECRVGGADLNPYLAAAALIAAGLHGIENELELPPITEGNAYTTDAKRLPTTLTGARDLLETSEIAKAAFGDDVVRHYVHAADVELDAYNATVTDWERIRGFERL